MTPFEHIMVRLAEVHPGMTERAASLEVSEGANADVFRNMKRGRARLPNAKYLHGLAKLLDVPADWIASIGSDEGLSSEDVAAGLDYADESIRQDEPPFEGAVAQISGPMGGGSTGAVITREFGGMQTIEPVAAWWRIPDEAIAGFGFGNVRQQHIVGWYMDGSSMEPTIQRTDVVFVDTRRKTPDAEGIFAVDYGEGRTMKRIRIKRDGENVRYLLISDNAEMFSPVEVPSDEVTIIGRYLFRFTVF